MKKENKSQGKYSNEYLKFVSKIGNQAEVYEIQKYGTFEQFFNSPNVPLENLKWKWESKEQIRKFYYEKALGNNSGYNSSPIHIFLISKKFEGKEEFFIAAVFKTLNKVGVYLSHFKSDIMWRKNTLHIVIPLIT